MSRPPSGAAAVVVLAALSIPALVPVATATAGTDDAYCRTLRVVRAADRAFDDELEELGIEALTDESLGRVRRLFRRLARTAPRAVEEAAQTVADFSLEFLDVAAGDDPLEDIEEYVDRITAAEERRLGRAVRKLDRFSRRECGVPFAI